MFTWRLSVILLPSLYSPKYVFLCAVSLTCQPDCLLMKCFHWLLKADFHSLVFYHVSVPYLSGLLFLSFHHPPCCLLANLLLFMCCMVRCCVFVTITSCELSHFLLCLCLQFVFLFVVFTSPACIFNESLKVLCHL